MTRSNWANYFYARSEVRIPSSLRLVMGAVSGAALSLSSTGFYLSIYAWVCVGILLVALFGARPRVAFGCGFLHGLFFSLTSLPWIATVLERYAGVSLAAGWGLLLLIAAAWGILTGGFAWTVHRLSQRSVEFACLGAPFVWVAFEFARAHLPEIGFPWNLLGYPAAGNLGLAQIGTVTGIYGLSFVVAGMNSLLAWADAGSSLRVKTRLKVLFLAAAFLGAAMLALPYLVPKPQAHHLARAVQLNFPEAPVFSTDWFAEHVGEIAEIERESLQPDRAQVDLLVWPEAPAPFSFQDPRFAKVAENLARRFHHTFIAGAIEWRPGDATEPQAHNGVAAYNSALVFDERGQRIFSYDKIHLVPFGEYEPFPLIDKLVTRVSGEVGGFRKGQSTYSAAPLPGGTSAGMFICYEAIFPNEVRHFVVNGAQLLINISNDGWFGRSAAARQHLMMARMRAVENRRWMVRATNNGYTASVDPYGRMLQPIPPDVRAAADLPYDFRTDLTIYTRFGDWFAWLCVLVSAILLASTYWNENALSENISVPVDFLATSIKVVPDPV